MGQVSGILLMNRLQAAARRDCPEGHFWEDHPEASCTVILWGVDLEETHLLECVSQGVWSTPHHLFSFTLYSYFILLYLLLHPCPFTSTCFSCCFIPYPSSSSLFHISPPPFSFHFTSSSFIFPSQFPTPLVIALPPTFSHVVHILCSPPLTLPSSSFFPTLFPLTLLPQHPFCSPLFPPHSSHSHPPPPLSSHLLLLDTGSHQIFMLLEQGPIAQTHTLLSAVLLRCVRESVCVCVYYLYIRWFSVSAGIANMFLNISSEIVWNSPVADDDSLTALSGPWRFHDNTNTHTHTNTHTIHTR